jgi:hypothetical protein
MLLEAPLVFDFNVNITGSATIVENVAKLIDANVIVYTGSTLLPVEIPKGTPNTEFIPSASVLDTCVQILDPGTAADTHGHNIFELLGGVSAPFSPTQTPMVKTLT